MNRLKAKFSAAEDTGSKLLSIFVTTGFPERDSAPELVWALEEAGADFVELGMPFSDPLADGPTIQRSSQVALRNGITVREVLQQVSRVRQRSSIPVVLMGYVNPMLKYGLARFMNDARDVGADGLIIPDLTPEEFRGLSETLTSPPLGVNFLVSPVTPPERVQWIDASTSDFIYCVSVTGVTGRRDGVAESVLTYLGELAGRVRHPLMVGFGVSRGADARAICRVADGVIIGSAVIELIERSSSNAEMLKSLRGFVGEIKSAMQGV